MKHFFVLLIIIITISACKKDKNNTPQNTSNICFDTVFLSTNAQETLESVYFLNAKDGFVAGGKGGIFKTTDSAKSWLALNTNTNLPILGLYFLTPQIGFAVGGENYCSGTGCKPAGGFIIKQLMVGKRGIKLIHQV